MKKTILTFGLISGVISSILMAATVPFADHSYKSVFVGYTMIVLSLLLVFFGIKSYRDNIGGGHITFGKAFAIGISIAVISCLFYVATWEVIYFKFMPDFWDKYSAYIVQKMQASGASSADIAAKAQELKKFKESYDNPLINFAYTFIEPFPVGLLVTLISAAILRKKGPGRELSAA